MALILPKGIVVNDPEISGQIERFNTEPLDLADIAKFWKVYTTTKRRLLDPTAERLENYWWRIWGSRSRELNGATIARLFAYISDGQSFVPLRGPANRDDGTTPLNNPTRHGLGAASATTLHRPSQARPNTTSSSTVPKVRVVMPPPILKTNKSPSLSTNAPRTARFVSPHESEVETNTHSSSLRSISPNSHVVVQPPSPDSKSDKKIAGSGGSKKKGFVASSAAKKTRPVISRRQSSQSSTDSPRIEPQSSVERTPPSRFQENFSPQPQHLAAQSTRKRPSPKKPSRKGKEVIRSDSVKDQGVDRQTAGPSSNIRSTENLQVVLGKELTEEELLELELQQTLLEQANARKVNRSLASEGRSENTQDDLRVPQSSIHPGALKEPPQDLGAVRRLPHDAKGTAKVALASAEATGHLDLSDSTNLHPPSTQVLSVKGRSKGKDKYPEDVKRTGMFAKRPVLPISTTTPASIPDGLLARSKSQLTLLLEKDRARGTDKKSRDSSEKE